MENTTVNTKQGYFINVINSIIEQKKDINYICSNGATLLHNAVLFSDYKIIEEMLKYGADANKKDLQGKNIPLHLAIDLQLDNISNLLIDYTTDINSQDSANFTAFHFAAKMNNTSIMKKLLKNNADYSILKDENGNLPIHYVVSNNNIEILKLIVNKKDIYVKNYNGKNAINIAILLNHKEAFSIILESYS